MKNKKIILSITLIVALLIITIGVTYAAFVYRENTNNQQLVSCIEKIQITNN